MMTKILCASASFQMHLWESGAIDTVIRRVDREIVVGLIDPDSNGLMNGTFSGQRIDYAERILPGLSRIARECVQNAWAQPSRGARFLPSATLSVCRVFQMPYFHAQTSGSCELDHSFSGDR